MELKDVHFGYDNSEVIHGISFTAKEGTVTALVGPSGSGKSTLAKLIARFWDVDAGAILVGGADIREIALPELMEQISFVSQDNFLFNMTPAGQHPHRETRSHRQGSGMGGIPGGV